MKPHLSAFFLTVLAASAYDRLQGPTELLFCDQRLAQPGYTLFGVGNRTFLLDLDGQVVHTWPLGTNPHLLDNGRILDASKDDPSGFQGFREVDWEGRTVWEYTEQQAPRDISSKSPRRVSWHGSTSTRSPATARSRCSATCCR